MIYYCMYKDECSFKQCIYRKVESKFSNSGDKRDLTINGFECIMVNSRVVRLISDERIICDRYRQCDINCPFKTTYITVNNFRKYFRWASISSKPFKCIDIGETVILQTAGENIGSYISIWDQPNLFSKKNAMRKVKWV